MGRILEITYEGKDSNFTVKKISRSKLYGLKRRIPVDAQGHECSRASLTHDGMYILPNGSTAMLYLNEQGDVVERDQLSAIDTDGEIIKPGESALNTTLEITQVTQITDLLECTITHAYALEPIFLSQKLNTLLSQSAILRLTLPHTTRNRESFLLGNDTGYFLLVGEQSGFEFIGLAEADLSPPDIGEDDHDIGDNLDFGMI